MLTVGDVVSDTVVVELEVEIVLVEVVVVIVEVLEVEVIVVVVIVDEPAHNCVPGEVTGMLVPSLVWS